MLDLKTQSIASGEASQFVLKKHELWKDVYVFGSTFPACRVPI